MTKDVVFESSGYQLIEINNAFYFFAKKELIFKGPLDFVIKNMVKKLDFDFHELNIAVMQMGKHNHNCAIFGIFKRFIYTLSVGVNNDRQAS